MAKQLMGSASRVPAMAPPHLIGHRDDVRLDVLQGGQRARGHMHERRERLDRWRQFEPRSQCDERDISRRKLSQRSVLGHHDVRPNKLEQRVPGVNELSERVGIVKADEQS